jgi:hypothetical protein
MILGIASLLSLSLLVLRIYANDPQNTLSFDDLAITAYSSD